MAILETRCTSLTGPLLYSDCFSQAQSDGAMTREKTFESFPILTSLASAPIIGIVAGITRMALAILHMIGHLFCALIFWDKGHLYHTAKGGAEFLRGIIETIPIIGRIFVWKHDALSSVISLWDGFKPSITSTFFLIKIYNPDKPDYLDVYRKTAAPIENIPICDKQIGPFSRIAHALLDASINGSPPYDGSD